MSELRLCFKENPNNSVVSSWKELLNVARKQVVYATDLAKVALKIDDKEIYKRICQRIVDAQGDVFEHRSLLLDLIKEQNGKAPL